MAYIWAGLERCSIETGKVLKRGHRKILRGLIRVLKKLGIDRKLSFFELYPLHAVVYTEDWDCTITHKDITQFNKKWVWFLYWKRDEHYFFGALLGLEMSVVSNKPIRRTQPSGQIDKSL